MGTKLVLMENENLIKAKKLIQNLKKLKISTENNLDLLKIILSNYNTLQIEGNLKGFKIVDLIEEVDSAKYKRVNVSKKFKNQEFKRIKDLAIFRIEHNCAIIN